MAKETIVILLALEGYLRNFIESQAFGLLEKSYDICYLVVEGQIRKELLSKYNICRYEIISQSKFRAEILRNYLILTMFKYSRIARGFRHKMFRLPRRKRWLYYFFSFPLLYYPIHFIFSQFLPVWKELDAYLKRLKPSLIIMPSLAADTWTIDMINTAKKRGVKSLVLINSWDNLVSKGVIPIAPDYLGVWGKQGVEQALKVQRMPVRGIRVLGAPYFDIYFDRTKGYDEHEIYNMNDLHRNKKILLVAASGLPFDELGLIKILDEEICAGKYKDFAILYRPHPWMVKREDERHFSTYGFKNVFFDKQLEAYYNARFDEKGNFKTAEHVELPALDYYPKLMKIVSGIISPLSTITLEGALKGIPSVMICYSDDKNKFLPPNKVAEFEHVKDILEFPGVIPCFRKEELLSCVDKLVGIIDDRKIREKLSRATEYVVYRDDRKYSQRLLEAVKQILKDNLERS